MKILIQGGGLCGLTTAALLEQEGHEVIIVEKYENWNDPVGFGISLWGIALDIFRKIGIGDAVLEYAHRSSSFQALDGNGGELCKMDWHDALPEHEVPHIVKRHRIHAALRERCKDIKTHLGTTSREIVEHEKGVQVVLENGVIEDVDLVLGCDGVHSAVRKYFFEQKDPTYYGWKQWIFWVHPSVAVPESITYIWGPENLFTIFHGKEATAVWCTAKAPAHRDDPIEHRIERLQERFSHINYLVPEILSKIEDPADIFFGDIAVVEIDTWVKDRIALAGDAEHAPTPLMGLGASMATEDGLILAECIRDATTETLPDALKNYERRRQHRVRKTQTISKALWNLFTIENPLIVSLRNQAAPMLAPAVVKMSFGNILNDPV